ncbi:hypothetical protein B7494_g6130 [Chlorociboria aeruginascens]|nr:hypothetical protein B7494_g6130 [Chlorociboria aeruginascens]
MEICGNKVADVVLKHFHALPAKRKPQNRGDGVKEWVPLSGIVAQDRDGLSCLAIAEDVKRTLRWVLTGMKCLPQSKVTQANGFALHDWHAEIHAIRSLNRFLLEECLTLASAQKLSSPYIRFRTPEEKTDLDFQPFALNDGINLFMYCSEAPCGDASMELTMAAQDDPTPWSMPISSTILPVPSPSPTPVEPALHGRGFFSELGIVRRKPSRPDAPLTLSKSCSDKLSLKQCTSLLSSLTSLLISPKNCYIHTLILPSSQYSPVACFRAFGASGRMKDMLAENGRGREWGEGYSFKPFRVVTTEREFEFSRRCNLEGKLVSSNLAASWTANGNQETLIGGVLQGRKLFDTRGASRMCNRNMWKLAAEISGLVGVRVIEQALGGEGKRYGDIKEGELLKIRRVVKKDVREKALKGWVKNEGDDFEDKGSLIDGYANVSSSTSRNNRRNPDVVKHAYSLDSIWRNRDTFLRGHDEIVAFLTKKWERENGYRLRKELFAFTDNKIAVQFWYEWYDESGQWWRTYGLEDWTFAEDGRMRKRQMSGNDVKLAESERWFKDGVDVNEVKIGEEHW